ncbi:MULTISPECIES: hypothetical protein [Kitasatospora]|uniref:Uncharacterized protein n=1 Tax=Kitasatospora setae (strain ATCC 33774 / DSM 43861 / JCM 3304 / KCC A-0304 / NBRC 14216 / KM-6054) TaxID=452652 RepID=E4N180_KITSK|nr:MULTISPECIES: hypothetical protein [Kitasatospora]BAJ31914.1 hypothetical protein KSE_61480 [Kitasatospora setae KM-6054]
MSQATTPAATPPAATTITTTLAYGPERRPVDVHRPRAGSASGPLPAALPAVLLWHGRGADEREVLAPLARAAAALGVLVVVPDWRPDGPDGGRADLLASATSPSTCCTAPRT